MVLVDTSVLINFFRGKETVGTAYFEKLLEKQKHFCINEFIYQELLQVAYCAFSAPQLSRQLCLAIRIGKGTNAG